MKYCKKCQCDTERYVCGKCKPCAAAYHVSNRERRVAYRLANAKRIKASEAAYRKANPDKVKASRAASRAANPDKARASQAAYRLANPDKKKASDAAYRKKNPDKAKARQAAWKKDNPEAVRINHANDKAKRRAREGAGGKLSKGLSAKLFELQKGKCACCGLPLGEDFHMDHIEPVSRGGTNTDDNIQLLRAVCNMQKGAKDPIQFMQSRGKLL